MTALRRYDLETVGPMYMTSQELVEREEGDWVRYEDVGAIVAERETRIERLSAEVSAWEERARHEVSQRRQFEAEGRRLKAREEELAELLWSVRRFMGRLSERSPSDLERILADVDAALAKEPPK